MIIVSAQVLGLWTLDLGLTIDPIPFLGLDLIDPRSSPTYIL